MDQRRADTINDEMVRQMEQRRKAQPERRQRAASAQDIKIERRRVCTFCYQPGDHQTPAHCLRALERS